MGWGIEIAFDDLEGENPVLICECIVTTPTKGLRIPDDLPRAFEDISWTELEVLFLCSEFEPVDVLQFDVKPITLLKYAVEIIGITSLGLGPLEPDPVTIHITAEADFFGIWCGRISCEEAFERLDGVVRRDEFEGHSVRNGVALLKPVPKASLGKK